MIAELRGRQGEAMSALGSGSTRVAPHAHARSLDLFTLDDRTALPDRSAPVHSHTLSHSRPRNMATVAAAVGAAHLVGYLDARWRLADDLRVVAGAAKVKVKLDKCNKQ